MSWSDVWPNAVNVAKIILSGLLALGIVAAVLCAIIAVICGVCLVWIIFWDKRTAKTKE